MIIYSIEERLEKLEKRLIVFVWCLENIDIDYLKEEVEFFCFFNYIMNFLKSEIIYI